MNASEAFAAVQFVSPSSCTAVTSWPLLSDSQTWLAVPIRSRSPDPLSCTVSAAIGLLFWTPGSTPRMSFAVPWT